MSIVMNNEELEVLRAQATELAKGIKSEKDLGELTRRLVKMTYAVI